MISFHSLEDRLVKQFFRRHSQPFEGDCAARAIGDSQRCACRSRRSTRWTRHSRRRRRSRGQSARAQRHAARRGAHRSGRWHDDRASTSPCWPCSSPALCRWLLRGIRRGSCSSISSASRRRARAYDSRIRSACRSSNRPGRCRRSRKDRARATCTCSCRRPRAPRFEAGRPMRPHAPHAPRGKTVAVRRGAASCRACARRSSSAAASAVAGAARPLVVSATLRQCVLAGAGKRALQPRNRRARAPRPHSRSRSATRLRSARRSKRSGLGPTSRSDARRRSTRACGALDMAPRALDQKLAPGWRLRLPQTVRSRLRLPSAPPR